MPGYDTSELVCLRCRDERTRYFLNAVSGRPYARCVKIRRIAMEGTLSESTHEFVTDDIIEEPAVVAPHTIDRRGFLRGVGATALLGSLAALGGCAPAAQKEPANAEAVAEPLSVDGTEDCDIVIVGAGGSGLAAAVEASEAGARVICVEREAAAGGGEAGVEGIFAARSSAGSWRPPSSASTDRATSIWCTILEKT